MLVSTGKAAELLGVTRRSLQKWAEAGQIEPDYVTPGGHMRWDVGRLSAAVARGPESPRPDPDIATSYIDTSGQT